LKELEKGFILDGVPLSKVANDETDRTNPTLNLGIPQYNGKKDTHCRLHYSKKSSDYSGTDSMMGHVYDNLCFASSSRNYIDNRKEFGAGRCMFMKYIPINFYLLTTKVYLIQNPF